MNKPSLRKDVTLDSTDCAKEPLASERPDSDHQQRFVDHTEKGKSHTMDVLGHPQHLVHYSRRLDHILPLDYMSSGQGSEADVAQLTLA